MDTPQKTTSAEKPYRLALSLVFQLGLIIAVPIFLLGLGGAYADREIGTSPYLVIGGFVLALLLSGLMVWSRVRSVVRAMEK